MTIRTKHPSVKMCKKVNCPDLVPPDPGAPGAHGWRPTTSRCRVTDEIPGNMVKCPKDRIPEHEIEVKG